MIKSSKSVGRPVSFPPARPQEPTLFPASEQVTGTARELRRIQRGKMRSSDSSQASNSAMPPLPPVSGHTGQLPRVPPSLGTKVRHAYDLILGYLDELSAYVQARHIAGDNQYTLRQAITEAIISMLASDPPA